MGGKVMSVPVRKELEIIKLSKRGSRGQMATVLKYEKAACFKGKQ